MNNKLETVLYGLYDEAREAMREAKLRLALGEPEMAHVYYDMAFRLFKLVLENGDDLSDEALLLVTRNASTIAYKIGRFEDAYNLARSAKFLDGYRNMAEDFSKLEECSRLKL